MLSLSSDDIEQEQKTLQDPNHEDWRNVKDTESLCTGNHAESLDDTEEEESTPGGIRTPDLRIRNPEVIRGFSWPCHLFFIISEGFDHCQDPGLQSIWQFQPSVNNLNQIRGQIFFLNLA